MLTAGAVALAACTDSGPDPAVIERGAVLYEAPCLRCHGGPDGGDPP